ncbi:MAG: neutral zinc metallopeptidase [Propionibacteriaceae bacterium]|nr:neutral zinc metallopeptidase [Propionibacteriaceae bacterium]
MTQPSWPQQGPQWGPPASWGATGQFQPPPGYGPPEPPRFVPQPPPPPRGGALRAVLLAGALVVVAAMAGLVLAGFLAQSREDSSPSAPPTAEPTVPAPTPAPSVTSSTPQPDPTLPTPAQSETVPAPEPSPLYPTLIPPAPSLTPAPPTPVASPSDTAPPPSATPTPAAPQPIPTPSGVGTPEKKPKDLPFPRTDAQARKWTDKNPLYSQKVKVPTRCGMPLIKPATISKSNLKKHLTRVAGCLTMVWRPAVRAAGYSMPYPVTTVFTGHITSPCGDLTGYNAYYCSGNQRIYFDTQLHEILPERDYSLDLIMAHEYGHAVQARTGIFISAIVHINQSSTLSKAKQYWRRLELQADCFAGIGMNALAQHTGIGKADREGFGDIMKAIADDTILGEIDQHGSAKARTRWLNRGLDGAKISACRTFTAAAGQVR